MNYSAISFPGLGLELNPGTAIGIGSLSIRYYGIAIALGLMLAFIYGCRRGKDFGIKLEDITDGVLCIVPFAVLCARLYYCIFQWEHYKDNLISILYIWEGGLAIYGGVIGAAIGVIVFSKVKKIRVGAVLDITSLGFLIGQSLGRWGNFFNREAFGAETESFLRMGLYKKVTESGAIINSSVMYFYHPTFLYESLWNAAGFVLLHFLSKKRKYDGQVALMYVAWYGLGRTFIEGLRTDSLYWGDFRVSQLLAAFSCFAAVSAMLYFYYFKRPNPANMQVRIYQRQQKEAEKAARKAAKNAEKSAEKND